MVAIYSLPRVCICVLQSQVNHIWGSLNSNFTLYNDAFRELK